MAGRKRGRAPKSGSRPARQGTIEKALAATHQHSVPVLAADAPDLPAETTTPARTRTTARVPAARVAGRGPRPSIGPQRVTRAASVASRVPSAAPRSAHDTPPGGAPLGDAPGKATLMLPALVTPSAKVPAVVAKDARQPAVLDAGTAPALLIRGAARPPRPRLHIVPRRQGGRSFLAQFVGAMVIAIALIGTATLASPLGKTAGISGISSLAATFQTAANAAPWVPTPTPTPTPKPAPPTAAAPVGPVRNADPGQQAIINMIVAVFGPYATGALAVARCESGYDTNAWNPYPILGSHASGVFQILYPSTWAGTSYARYSPYDPGANIHAAYEIFSRDGHTWREWQCQP